MSFWFRLLLLNQKSSSGKLEKKKKVRPINHLNEQKPRINWYDFCVVRIKFHLLKPNEGEFCWRPLQEQWQVKPEPERYQRRLPGRSLFPQEKGFGPDPAPALQKTGWGIAPGTQCLGEVKKSTPPHFKKTVCDYSKYYAAILILGWIVNSWNLLLGDTSDLSRALKIN